jgi:hypothetical protein
MTTPGRGKTTARCTKQKRQGKGSAKLILEPGRYTQHYTSHSMPRTNLAHLDHIHPPVEMQEDLKSAENKTDKLIPVLDPMLGTRE